MLRSLQETGLGEEADVVVGPSRNTAAARATGEILVFLEPDAVVLPDWLAPLLRVLRDQPQAGAVGGKVLALDGRLEYGGGVVTAGGLLHALGDDEYSAEGPLSDVVRSVDWCSPVVLATRRTVFEAVGGFNEHLASAPHAAADYCLRVRERGLGVLFQPDSTAVRVETTPGIGEPPADFVARWSHSESAP
jgi:GT2 family glycosyltransferase